MLLIELSISEWCVLKHQDQVNKSQSKCKWNSNILTLNDRYLRFYLKFSSRLLLELFHNNCRKFQSLFVVSLCFIVLQALTDNVAKNWRYIILSIRNKHGESQRICSKKINRWGGAKWRDKCNDSFNACYVLTLLHFSQIPFTPVTACICRAERHVRFCTLNANYLVTWFILCFCWLLKRF